jgi:polysaccharide pyruvyl transferase WcaK-like protein
MKVGIALRDLSHTNYNKRVLSVLRYLLKMWAHLVFIPHSFHKTDSTANDYVFLSWLKAQIWIKWISICKNMNESYRCYKYHQVDMVLAQRLHSIILSEVYWIPFIWLSYSRKTDEVLKQIML